MTKNYRITARYYRPKSKDFTDSYTYCIETDKTIKQGDCIAVIDAASPSDIRCMLVSNVIRLAKDEIQNDVRHKVFVGIVETTFFHEVILEMRRKKLLAELEQHAAQASKMQYYETLAATDTKIASLLKELKEIS